MSVTFCQKECGYALIRNSKKKFLDIIDFYSLGVLFFWNNQGRTICIIIEN